MILLLSPNPSSHIQNPKTNKQLILQKLVIPKGHNYYSCSKRNNTKCPNLHKHVGMLRDSPKLPEFKAKNTRPGARKREREKERSRAREREKSLRVLKCTTEFASFMYDERAHAKCRKVVRERPAGDRVSDPGTSGYHSGYVDINAAPEIKSYPPTTFVRFLISKWTFSPSLSSVFFFLNILFYYFILFYFILIKFFEMKPFIFETRYLNF